MLNPDEDILEKIKSIYLLIIIKFMTVHPEEIKEIKQKYNKKIITALTIKDER